MIVPVCFALCLVTVPLLGGNLRLLARVRIDHAWLVITSLVLQTFVIEILATRTSVWLSETLHLVTYAMAATFFWFNRYIPGAPWLAIGGGANMAAIVANGGVMPASDWAVRVAGLAHEADAFSNSRPVENARLWFLGDVFPIPKGWPLANVFSVGDVLLVVGAAVSVHCLGRSRACAHRRARDRSLAAAARTTDATARRYCARCQAEIDGGAELNASHLPPVSSEHVDGLELR